MGGSEKIISTRVDVKDKIISEVAGGNGESDRVLPRLKYVRK